MGNNSAMKKLRKVTSALGPCMIVIIIALVFTVTTPTFPTVKNILTLMQSALAALRPVVVALIAGAGLSLLKTALFSGEPTLPGLDWLQAVLFLAAFFLLRRKKPSPILTMFGCGLIYLLFHLP